MGTGERFLSLAAAVCLSLWGEGINLLNRPEVLKSYLMDYMNPDSPELRVLIRNCDESLLAPYAACMGGGVGELRFAAGRVRAHLVSECMINPPTASLVANGIAAGIASWCGIAWDAQAQNDATGAKRGKPEQNLRRGAVPGIFIDAREQVHICSLCFGDDSKDPQFDVETLELIEAKRRLAQLRNQSSSKDVEVVAAASDLALHRYPLLRDRLQHMGINVCHWCLPTDALTLVCYVRGQQCDIFLMLAVHMGASRCAVGLYECCDGVIECLAVLQADVNTDLYQRQSVLRNLVTRIDGDSGDCISSRREDRKVLRICVVDELELGPEAERTLRAAFASSADPTWRIEFVIAEPGDIARGLAARGGVRSGDFVGFLPLEATFFDIFLEGTEGNTLLIEHGTTVPTSRTELIQSATGANAQAIPLGMLTAVIIAEPSGDGLRFPFACFGTQLSPGSSQIVYVTGDIDADARCKLTFEDRQNHKSFQCILEDYLDKATHVIVERKEVPRPGAQ